MGNDLGQFQNRMTAENWEFLLTMLQKTTDKLLIKRRIDNLLKDAKFERRADVDVFDPPAGADHRVLGRIRPVARRTEPRVARGQRRVSSNMSFNFGTGKPKKGVASPRLLETLPPAWTEESIKQTQESLKKLEADSKLNPPPNTPLDKKMEIRPPKPQNEKAAWTALNHWTVFGYLPNLDLNEAKKGIDEMTENLKLKTIKVDDRAVCFSAGGTFIGRIFPKRITSQSVFSKVRQRETSGTPVPGEIPPPLPVEEEITPTSPKVTDRKEGDGKRKKRKRRNKKRTLDIPKFP